MATVLNSSPETIVLELTTREAQYVKAIVGSALPPAHPSEAERVFNAIWEALDDHCVVSVGPSLFATAPRLAHDLQEDNGTRKG